MLIGYTDEMTDQQVAELADWADYHAKDTAHWKRAYALIREGADLLLRRRACMGGDPITGEPVRKLEVVKLITTQCLGTHNGSYCAEHKSAGPHDNRGRGLTNSRGPGVMPVSHSHSYDHV